MERAGVPQKALREPADMQQLFGMQRGAIFHLMADILVMAKQQACLPQSGQGLSSLAIFQVLITILGHTWLSGDGPVELAGGRPHEGPERAPSRN